MKRLVTLKDARGGDVKAASQVIRSDTLCPVTGILEADIALEKNAHGSVVVTNNHDMNCCAGVQYGHTVALPGDHYTWLTKIAVEVVVNTSVVCFRDNVDDFTSECNVRL